jgi:Cell wall-active antibiotics response LiaF, C-terminal
MQTIPTEGAQPALPPVPPGPPVPARQRSPLGRLVLSLALFAVGVVALIDMAGVSVPAGVYFAVPLLVVAGGLVAGAWYGRARGLIAVGVILSVLLAITLAADRDHLTGSRQSVTWRPAGIAQVESTYRVDTGNALLDLSRVDFTGHATAVDVHVSAGNLTIVLPSTVDVQVRASVAIGNASVLGQRWSGIGQSQHTVTDSGVDGTGGGQLTLTATVNVGNLEVRR